MAEIGLAAAALAELGIEALKAGDMARAVGTLGSINEESWQALAQRFPGFPAGVAEAWARHAVASGSAAAIEVAGR
jgi:hypothetical protein